MIDIETMARTSRAAILSIGAVQFNPENGHVGKTFYRNIIFDDEQVNNRDVEASTIKWWMGEGAEGFKKLQDPEPVHLYDALRDLAKWKPVGCRPWGNGAVFDIGILEDAYQQMNASLPYTKRIPWVYKNVRDMRTIVALCSGHINPKSYEREGTHHNALDDALHQVKIVSDCWQWLRRER